jgi:hypothetical protein
MLWLYIRHLTLRAVYHYVITNYAKPEMLYSIPSSLVVRLTTHEHSLIILNTDYPGGSGDHWRSGVACPGLLLVPHLDTV